MSRNRKWQTRVVKGILKFPVMIGLMLGMILLCPFLYIELLGCDKHETPWIVKLINWVDDNILKA